MNPEQFAQIMKAIVAANSLPPHYTITGAADWPMLLTLGGIVVIFIGAMWADLRGKISDHKTDFIRSLDEHKASIKNDIDKHKVSNTRDLDLMWAAMRDCQDDCCPRRKEPRIQS